MLSACDIGNPIYIPGRDTTYGRKIVLAEIYASETSSSARRIQIDTTDGPDGLEVEVILLDPLGDLVPSSLEDDINYAVREALHGERILSIKTLLQ
jgi:hypothetical protein